MSKYPYKGTATFITGGESDEAPSLYEIYPSDAGAVYVVVVYRPEINCNVIYNAVNPSQILLSYYAGGRVNPHKVLKAAGYKVKKV